MARPRLRCNALPPRGRRKLSNALFGRHRDLRVFGRGADRVVAPHPDAFLGVRMDRMKLRAIAPFFLAFFLGAVPVAASAASQPDFSAFTATLNRQLDQLEKQLGLAPAQ